MSPWLDLTLSGETTRSLAQIDPWITERACKIAAARYVANPRLPLVSPLYADLSGLAPMLIHDSTRFEEQARAAGVDIRLEVYQDLWHVWHLFAPMLPDANQALEAIH